MIFTLISFFFASLIFFMVLAIVMGAPLVPSKPHIARAMIALLKLKKGERLYDLGSGDGRLLLVASRQGARVFGIEINPFVWLLSYIQLFAHGVFQAKIILGNYWWVNLQRADAVVVYALPTVMERLSQKLKHELKKGTRVVSNSFKIPGLNLVKEERVGKDRIYLYRV